MNFTSIRKIFYFASLAIFLTSCNKEYFIVGSELYNGEFEDLNSIVFPVFSYQESTSKVATNNLPHVHLGKYNDCLLYTSPSPRDKRQSRMPSSA